MSKIIKYIWEDGKFTKIEEFYPDVKPNKRSGKNAKKHKHKKSWFNYYFYKFKRFIKKTLS